MTIKNDNEIIVFKDSDLELEVNVSHKEETVWLTQEQMAKLFNVDRSRITRHINNIYNDDELDRGSTSAENAQVQIEGDRQVRRNVNIYNLDMIISVGYRVNSKRGITFRKWANSILKEYMLKGFSIDKERLTSNSLNYIEFVDTVKVISSLVDRK